MLIPNPLTPSLEAQSKAQWPNNRIAGSLIYLTIVGYLFSEASFDREYIQHVTWVRQNYNTFEMRRRLTLEWSAMWCDIIHYGWPWSVRNLSHWESFSGVVEEIGRKYCIYWGGSSLDHSCCHSNWGLWVESRFAVIKGVEYQRTKTSINTCLIYTYIYIIICAKCIWSKNGQKV